MNVVAIKRKVDAEKALQMRRDGLSMQEIASQFGVSRQRIHQYLKANHADGLVKLVRKCGICGSEFSRKFRAGSIMYCSKQCKRAAVAIASKKRSYDLCQCGRRKTRRSERCQQCCWKFDLSVAYEAYQAGATARQMAEYWGIEKSGIYNHFRRRGMPTRGRGFRCSLSDKEAFQLLALIEAARKLTGDQS